MKKILLTLITALTLTTGCATFNALVAPQDAGQTVARVYLNNQHNFDAKIVEAVKRVHAAFDRAVDHLDPDTLSRLDEIVKEDLAGIFKDDDLVKANAFVDEYWLKLNEVYNFDDPAKSAEAVNLLREYQIGIRKAIEAFEARNVEVVPND